MEDNLINDTEDKNYKNYEEYELIDLNDDSSDEMTYGEYEELCEDARVANCEYTDIFFRNSQQQSCLRKR